MIERASNIDLVFRNGLKEFEVLPPADLWDGIRPVVRKKSLRGIYLRAASVAGLMVTGTALALYLSGLLSVSLNGPALTMNQDNFPTGKYTPVQKAVSKGEIRTAIPVTETAVNDKTADSPQETLTAFSVPYKNSQLFTQVSSGSFSDRQKRFDLSGNRRVAALNLPSLGDLASTYSVNETKNVQGHKNRWSIGAFVTPSYYSKMGTDNSDAGQSLSSTEVSTLSYSGGMSVGYRVNKRFSLQMGLYYNSLNQEIDGVRTYSGFMKYYSMKGNDNFTVETSNGTIVTRNNDIFLANTANSTKVTGVLSKDVFDPNKAGLNYINSSLLQSINYLEIPFIVRYKFIDRTFGMNLIGGVSFNQLLNNSAYTVADGSRYFIGHTEGLYPVTLSSSLGLGMEYNLSSRISFNLEPTVRYFLTPISGQTSSSLHPYTFGILSGLSWKF
jgi:hypothetical protein